MTDVDGSLGVDAARVVVDAVEFQKYARQDTPHALATAAEIYRGDLFEGFDLGEEPFEEWLTAERERLRETARVEGQQPDAGRDQQIAGARALQIA